MDPTTPDPTGTIAQIYQFILSGHGVAAAGAALMLVVWVERAVLASKWKWFRTALGGYVLGYSSSALLYLGGALVVPGAKWSWLLLLNALGAGWAASGAWEKLRDILTAMNRPPRVTSAPAKAPGPTDIVTNMKRIALFALTAVAVAGCSWFKSESKTVAQDVVDCTTGELAKLGPIAIPLALGVSAGTTTWDQVVQAAIDAGKDVGGCILSDIIVEVAKLRAVGSAQHGEIGAGELERFRSAVGTTKRYHTSAGDL